MKPPTIGDMIRALQSISRHLDSERRSFVEIAAECSKQGSDTSLLSDKEKENILVWYAESCTWP